MSANEISNRWISIDDSLPSENTSVFVLQDGNNACDRLIVQAALFDGQFYADHMNNLIDYDDRLIVKYWMPIPF